MKTGKILQKLRESRRSKSVQAKRDFVRQAWERQGTRRGRLIDPDEYPPIPGMEGPFSYRSGRVLYYDPREGRYYDRKTDMYLSRDIDPMQESPEEGHDE